MEKSYVWGADLAGTKEAAGGIGGLVNITNYLTGRTYQPLFDGMGNVTELVDESGAVVARYRYNAYGTLLEASGTNAGECNFRFSTKFFDAEVGLYWYGYRFYSPELGRWLSRDPLGEIGEVNLYNFIRNNPYRFVDALGLAWYNPLDWFEVSEQTQADLYLSGANLLYNTGYFFANYAGPISAGTLVAIYGAPAITSWGTGFVVGGTSAYTTLTYQDIAQNLAGLKEGFYPWWLYGLEYVGRGVLGGTTNIRCLTKAFPKKTKMSQLPPKKSITGFVEWSNYQPPQAQKWFNQLLKEYEKTGKQIEYVESWQIPGGGRGIMRPKTEKIYVELEATQGTIAEELYHYQQLKARGLLGKTEEEIGQKIIDEIEREAEKVLRCKGYTTLEDIRRGK
jgi:RHS repeat-associated protein